jgi:hypothetical protein
LIAERVSALALSMTSFSELLLLAAESWLEAGDSRRAMPYARDLVDAPGIDEGLLLQAQRVLARAVGAAPEGSPANKKTYADSIPAAALPPSRSVPPPQRPSKSPLTAPEIDAPQTFTPAQSRVPTQKGGTGAVVPAPPGSSQKPISTPEDD